jgi:hypothetical protein
MNRSNVESDSLTFGRLMGLILIRAWHIDIIYDSLNYIIFLNMF